MSKFNLGNKRVCAGCGTKFYDLGKNPAACPKCKVMNDINAQYRARRKSKAVVEADNDDPLIKQKASQDAKQKLKKSTQKIEGVDLGEFEDVPIADGENEIEEIDDIEDIEEIEELEDVEPEEPMDDDIAIDDDTLIDDIDDDESEEMEEEEEESPKPSKKSPLIKPSSKPKKK